MCGIVGIVGSKPVSGRLVEALVRLEYRGYDSAGVAVIDRGEIKRQRAEGKLVNLAKKLDEAPIDGVIGIGHTRWATHGAATENNAHPHVTARVAVVHNGIIENFRELLADLKADGYAPVSETDTESVVLLVTRELDRGATPEAAVAKTLKQLRGAFGLVFLFADDPQLLIAARQGSPLAIGAGDGENYIGSDAYALAALSNRITYLEEGDWAMLRPDTISIRDSDGNAVTRPQQISNASAVLVDKGNHRHFMAKEIYEQPETISHTLAHYLDMASETVAIREDLPFDFAKLSRITIVACGSAFIAGSVAKYWFEHYARLPVDVVAPSDDLMEKTLSNMQEVSARGGRIILITDEAGVKFVGDDTIETILIPKVTAFVAPILATIPVQLLAYHTAVFMGTDVDQPRNLAKSVTVE